MSQTKRYNLINNSLGWLCLIIAAVSYLLTIEPTASFWDCPEFILQGYKLEVGHPPGNPIFMLTARFFINFVGSDPGAVAAAVNSMNALLSAATILLLFWTITHLMRRLLTGYKPLGEIGVAQQAVIFGSGLVGALAYAWSDTFWYSAVEGEVYAFSSFCTALVFWLILKWENRADQPHSDRYIVLIAYVIGVSIAVHLLNLLCIPAIVLVFYYRKFANPSAKGSLLALLVSFVIVALILYGLVPGFVEVAQYSELFFVNVLGMNYNMGVVVYTVLTLGAFIWAIYELYGQKSPMRMKLAFALSVFMSGIPFIGSSLLIPVVVMGGLLLWLFKAKKLHVRILNVITLSIFVIFIGYSSYALLLIRASADTPVNQNSPDNVFDLGSYLNREQYGEAPLFYGTTFASEVMVGSDGKTVSKQKDRYAKAVPAADGTVTPHYDKLTERHGYEYVSETNTIFPRMYDSRFRDAYMKWGGFSSDDMKEVSFENYAQSYVYDPVTGQVMYDAEGRPMQEVRKVEKKAKMPTFGQNMSYFVNYQLIHMYFRYFMWNFAGRQNDIQGNGEANRGNWITGIPVLDNARLGDQSLLPADYGKGNKGHNVFYMLPLLLGLVGLVWQSFKGETGIRQFWVVFFLFFMTGIAIVLYLNQTPGQPRERDYAFAGSFYAFAIWIGLGVGAIAEGISKLMKQKEMPLSAAIIAGVVGLIVPLQMVSQTWDDHDRSGRYTARDFGMNYLASLEPNAIIFTNGDNDTFPLWYAQEVEGFRTDVRVINLSYLSQDWYAAQQQLQAYEAAPVDMLATRQDFGQGRRDQGLVLWPRGDESGETTMTVLDFLDDYYSNDASSKKRREYYAKNYGIDYADMAYGIPVNNLIIPGDSAKGFDDIVIENFPRVLMNNGQIHPGNPVIALTDALVLDIIATSAENGWNRPVYFANTVPGDYYMGLDRYMHNTGMAKQVVPREPDADATDIHLKAADNIKNFKWGGLDQPGGEDVYLDETVQRMVTSTRYGIIETATDLYYDGRLGEALALMKNMVAKLPSKNAPYGLQTGKTVAQLLIELGLSGGDGGTGLRDNEAVVTGLKILEEEIAKYAAAMMWLSNLDDAEYQSLDRLDKAVIAGISGYVRINGESAQIDEPFFSYFLDLLYYYYEIANSDAATETLDRIGRSVGFDIVGYSKDYIERFADDYDDYVEAYNQIIRNQQAEAEEIYNRYSAGEMNEKMAESAIAQVRSKTDRLASNLIDSTISKLRKRAAKFVLKH